MMGSNHDIENRSDQLIYLNEQGFLSKNFDVNKFENNYKDAFELTSKINLYVYGFYDELHIYNQCPLDLFFASSLAEIHKDYQAVCLLAQRGSTSQGKVVLRGLLEKLFVIKAICIDQTNFEKWLDSEKIKKRKIINLIKKKAVGLENINLEKIDMPEDIKNKETNANEWAKLAGMEMEYNLMYRLFSQNVHFSERTISKNLIVCKNEIDALDLSPDLKNIDKLLLTNIHCMIGTLKAVSYYFKIDNSKQLEAMEKVEEKIWKESIL